MSLDQLNIFWWYPFRLRKDSEMFYLLGCSISWFVLVSQHTLGLSSALISSGLTTNTINLRFVSPTYRSLAIVSLMAVLTLCDLLFILSQTAIPSSVIHCRSYILLISKTLIFAAAANWTRLILLGIYSGLNLTYLLSTISEPVFSPLVIIVRLVVQINAILFSGNNNVHYLLCLRSR